MMILAESPSHMSAHVRRFAEDGIAGYADGEARPASMERESVKLSGVTHALGRL